MKPPSTKHEAPEVQSPSRILPHHKLDRDISPVAGAPKAWRSESTLEAAYDQGKLQGGNSKYSAEARYEAGLHYMRIFLTSEASGKDSTQAMNISRSSRAGYENTAQSKAWTDRLAIESHLGQRDRIIVRLVCGENYWPSEAVRLVCQDYKDTVSARFREALDALVEAIETARRYPKKFNMEVKP